MINCMCHKPAPACKLSYEIMSFLCGSLEKWMLHAWLAGKKRCYYFLYIYLYPRHFFELYHLSPQFLIIMFMSQHPPPPARHVVCGAPHQQPVLPDLVSQVWRLLRHPVTVLHQVGAQPRHVCGRPQLGLAALSLHCQVSQSLSLHCQVSQSLSHHCQVSQSLGEKSK